MTYSERELEFTFAKNERQMKYENEVKQRRMNYKIEIGKIKLEIKKAVIKLESLKVIIVFSRIYPAGYTVFCMKNGRHAEYTKVWGVQITLHMIHSPC